MISQKFPYRVPPVGSQIPSVPAGGSGSHPGTGDAPKAAAHRDRAGRGEERHGPLRVQFHAAPRRQGPCFDSRGLPRRAGAGRVRRPLCLSDARPSGARCRRQCAARRDRAADRPLCAVLRRARGFFGGALRHQRDTENRWRGQGDPVRTAQGPRGARGGHRESARAQEAIGLPGGSGGPARSTGMMMGRDSGQPAVAGGPAPHIPVLGPQAVEFLAVREGGFYVDATFGAGGHSRAMLAAGNVKILGLDRDPSALALSADLVERAAGRLTLVQANFADLDSVAHEFGLTAADGVLLDLGVSSMQLDHAERGFSFRLEGPLDMRMSSAGPSAADILARASERDLAAIIATLGEERHARAVARAIAAARQRQAIRTTSELATIVARVVRGRPGDIHPATRTFQALRIFVNDELRSLAEALGAAERLLAPGGRLVTIAFHSLEDRIVKTFLAARGRPAAPSRHLPERVRAAPSFQILTRRPVVPDDAELAANPRARSAKLRAAERTGAAAHSQQAEALPRLPTPDEIMGRS